MSSIAPTLNTANIRITIPAQGLAPNWDHVRLELGSQQRTFAAQALDEGEIPLSPLRFGYTADAALSALSRGHSAQLFNELTARLRSEAEFVLEKSGWMGGLVLCRDGEEWTAQRRYDPLGPKGVETIVRGQTADEAVERLANASEDQPGVGRLRLEARTTLESYPGLFSDSNS